MDIVPQLGKNLLLRHRNMMSLYDITTVAASAVTTVSGVVYYIYRRYRKFQLSIAHRPTKAEVEELVNHETDKIMIRLDGMDNTIKDLHGDVQLLLNYMLYAQRPTPQNPDSSSPKNIH